MSITSLSADERETTIVACDGDEFVRIDSSRRKDITALRKRQNVTEVATGFHGSTEWARFLVPAHLFDVARGVRIPRTLSDEQREALADRARAFFGHSDASVSGSADEQPSGVPEVPLGDDSASEWLTDDLLGEADDDDLI